MADGSVAKIPYFNSVNLGASTFPIVKLVAVLGDRSWSVTYAGLTTVVGKSAHQIRVQPVFSQQDDPDGSRGIWGAVDFFVDASSLLLVKTQEQYHSIDNVSETYPRDIYFTNYQGINGLLVPTTVSELLAGQTNWVLKVTNVIFNTGLTDSDFRF